jgi:cytochrome c peroxidase
MRNRWLILSLLVGFLILLSSFDQGLRPYTLSYPEYWPAPHYDLNKNPLTIEGIALGRALFYDPILSENNTVSCANCHLSFTAFTHVDHALSHGIRDSIGTRNSMALMNLAWSRYFMWDGAVNHLDMQAIAPITHPAEMGEDMPHVIEKLNASAQYPDLFKEVFGTEKVTGEYLLKAISQFELTLNSSNSKYDKVMRKEDGVQFTNQEKKGYYLFQRHCNSCHTEPLFTSGEFKNNGLLMDPQLKDLGRVKISLDPRDSLKFKVPSLRNVEFSQPYMHDGRFRSLSQVLTHYAEGIQSSNTLASELSEGIALSPEDKVDLIAFLLSLTDKEFLFNPDHSFPRK